MKRRIIIAAVAIAAVLGIATPVSAAPTFTSTWCRTVEAEHTVDGTYYTFRVRTDDCVTRYLGGGILYPPTETLRQVVVSKTKKGS